MDKKITEILTRGVAEIIGKEELEKKMSDKKKLRIKFGIDPTGDLLHLGHAVALRKLKEFQDLGHTIILLIGDHTAEIGDPSGRSNERIPLSKEQIKINMASYQEQAGSILDMKKVDVRYNSEWYETLGIMDLARLTSYVSIAQILQRADFKKRMSNGEDVSFREAFYPLLQGYDSVMLKADVEIGGTDQKFNLLMGRQLQKRYGQEEQNVLMVPLLEGTDGVLKMSKTSGNYIALSEKPESMYGKIMSLPDTLIGRYFELATRVPMEEVAAIEEQMKKGVLNPRDAKMRLSREIVTLYHGAKKAENAENAFIKTFQKKEVPDTMPIVRVKKNTWGITDLLIETKLAASKGEGRRLIEQGGIVAGGQKITSFLESVTITPKGTVLQKGKRHFVMVKIRKEHGITT